MLRRLASLTFAVLGLVACNDDFGEPCTMPDTAEFEVLCDNAQNDGSETTSTCVFTNNAQCSTRMCARYLGEGDFCSQPCDLSLEDPDADCPGSASCRPAADGTGFCVPRRVVEVVESAADESE